MKSDYYRFYTSSCQSLITVQTKKKNDAASIP